MRNILYFVLTTLIISCSSDDSPNAPFGVLTKVEVYYPLTDLSTEITSTFNSSGKIASNRGRSITSGDNIEYTTSFSYNSNGQIWKSTTVYDGDNIDYTEFIFNDGLITSSIRYRNNGDELRTLYNYNGDNQLINKQHFNVDNEAAAFTDITFLADGNIENTYFEDIDGSIRGYTYEYDSNNNPQSTHFGNQELGKIVGSNINNVTNSYYSNDSSGATTEATIEYTYNEEGYPITSNEYSQSGTLTAQVTYTYQE